MVGEGRALDPARYSEDWAVLAPLSSRVWPVQGQTYGLRPVACVVDFQGAPGVSDNAERWLKARRKAGDTSWFVSRGHGGFRVPQRFWYEAPERGSRGKRARSIKILNYASDRLKDTVVAQLMRGEGVKGAMFVPSWMPDEQLAEFTAEERTDKGWQKRAGMIRNESLDLTVMARAAAEYRGLARINWEAPPDWARADFLNTYAVTTGEAEAESPAPPAPATPKPKATRRKGWIGDTKGWL
jgi:phage terminase large subunit GpA-like protein